MGKTWYDEEKMILHDVYEGMVNAELSMEVFREQLRFAKDNKIIGGLTDITKLKGTFTNLNEYLEQEYLPFLIERGFVALAMVVSHDIFSQYAAKDLVQRMEGFELHIFENYNEAESWLEERVGVSKEA